MLKEGMSSSESQSLQHMSDYERRLLKSPYAKRNKFHSLNQERTKTNDAGSVQSSVQVMPKGTKQREKERLLSNAVRHLPQEKKVDLLHSLSKLEDELRSPTMMAGGSLGQSQKSLYSGQRYHNYSNEMDENGSMYDDSSISIVSMSSLGFVDKKYGVVTESPLKIMQRQVVRCLCKVGKAIESSELRHVLGGRAMTEIVGLTALREFLHSRLHCSLTTKEAELLMKFIDTGNRGEVNIYDILGMAQLNYDKLKRQTKKKRDKGLLEIERKELLVKRRDFKAKCEEEHLKQGDLLPKILNTVQEASYKLLTSKHGVDLLQTCRRLIMNSSLFQEVLLEFGIEITLRERKLLEQRYSSLYPPRTGSVDFPSFKAEFISLGADLLMQRQKSESMERFVKTMTAVGAMTASGGAQGGMGLISGKNANALLPGSPTSHTGNGTDADNDDDDTYEVLGNPFRNEIDEPGDDDEKDSTRVQDSGSIRTIASSPSSSAKPSSKMTTTTASMKLDSFQSQSSTSAVTLSDVFQSAHMVQPTHSIPFGSSKKQPKRKLPKGGKLEALQQSQQSHTQPPPSSQPSSSSLMRSPQSSSSSLMRSPQANTRSKKVKVTSNTIANNIVHNIIGRAVASKSEGGTPSTGTTSVYVPQEDFEGHPDIAPGVTVQRNVTIRRRTLEGDDSGKDRNNNNNKESMRAAMDLLMDPENDLPLDQLLTIQSNSNSSIHSRSSKDNSSSDRRVSKSKKKTSISGDVVGVGGISKRVGEGSSRRTSLRDSSNNSDSDADEEEIGGMQTTRDEDSDVLGPLMVEVVHTDIDGSQRRSFMDSSSPVLSPSVIKSPSRRGSNTLSKSPSFGNSPSAPPITRTTSKPSPAHNVRRNSQRRVSELIREARQPSFNSNTTTTSTNMAINLTEPHAFTSSIAIMNMINSSSELMLDALTRDKAMSNPHGKTHTIGISSDFHRRLSVMSSSGSHSNKPQSLKTAPMTSSVVPFQTLSQTPFQIPSQAPSETTSQASSNRSSFEPNEMRDMSDKSKDDKKDDQVLEPVQEQIGLQEGFESSKKRDENEDEDEDSPPTSPHPVPHLDHEEEEEEEDVMVVDNDQGFNDMSDQSIEDLVGNNSKNPALAVVSGDDDVMIATITHYYEETEGIIKTASNDMLDTNSITSTKGKEEETAVEMNGTSTIARPPKGRPPPKQPSQSLQPP